MNYSEWQKACEEGWAPRKYDNLCRAEQRSLKYNPDPNATVRHHLRDTEEQRKYNDEHYELWGFNLDGTFEYGKYVIFVTEEWHNNYHKDSEDTKLRKQVATQASWDLDKDRHTKYSEMFSGEGNPFYGKTHSEESKSIMSEKRTGKFVGENHPFYGKHHTEESRKKMSESRKGKLVGECNPMYGKVGEEHPFYGHHLTEEHKQAISDAQKGKRRSDEEKEHNRIAHLGKHHTDDTKKRISSCISFKGMAYKEYKRLGGSLSWNDFQKIPVDDYVEYGIIV